MKNEFENFLTHPAGVNFGSITLSDGEREFYRDLNDEIIMLCRSLPESTQTNALMFLMQYTGMSFGDELDFFRHYPVPTWSIIYWLIQSRVRDKKLKQEDIKNAIAGHAMAMTLHSMDDHLTDHEMPVTHLTLLLRGQAWMIMNNAFEDLACEVDGGHEILRGLIDDYFKGIFSSAEMETLDHYCELFRKQMATGLIAPALLAERMTTPDELSSDIMTAYGSFGIAWRLLDDIKDIEIDMMKSLHTSIYVCLPQDLKKCWDKYTEEEPMHRESYNRAIWDHIRENGVIDKVVEKIRDELESAVSIADSHRLTGLANEFRALLAPLAFGQNSL
ncbi:MAG: hypothetical protein GTO13_05555 [Proteobacteria bacterium]|nr:hypothetical protein [Pseudomonadota bacterium]NIS60171.1 hypothetical protein [Pseudomonadota bacterium]